MNEKLKIFATTVEDTARAQIDEMNECEAYGDCTVRIMPDCHAGKGCTIGTVIEVKDRIVPNTVGVDIGCLDCDTEVLTPNGWIRIADYHRQEIMQYDPQSDSGTFCKPIAYIKNKCDKFFYFKNSKGLDQMVSEEHKMLVYRGYNGSHRYQNENPSFFVGRKGVEKGYYRFKSCFNVVSEGIRMSEELIHIDVMVQADGRLREYVDYNFVELHFKKQRKIKRSMELLEKANIGYRHYKQSDGTTVVSFRAPKCIDKNLKKYYNASYEQLAVVAEECLYWDGHIGYRSFYSSTNKDNADVIQYAFTATNNRAAIYCHNENKKGWSDCYNVIKTRNKFVGYNVEPQIVSSKDGYKYCFTTLTGYFVCRRNGHVFITGNCGMMVCEIMDKDIDLERLDKVVNEYVPAGFNVHDEPVCYSTELDDLRCIKAVKKDYMQRSIGSLGGGNHFIEVDKARNGTCFLVIHSGSRNLGVTVCDYYQKIAEKECGIDPKERQALIDRLKAEGRQREIAAEMKKLQPKVRNMSLAYLEGQSFTDYLHDMEIAQRYALLNRRMIASIIADHMDWSLGASFHTVHNYIDTCSMILRKGAVDAWSGLLIIPMNMRDGSLLCKGLGNPDWLWSAPHGAGRLMSRKQAFDTLKMQDFTDTMSDIYSTSVCPETIDESPMAYKPMQEIIDQIGDTVEIIDIIKPIYNFKAKNGR